MKAFLLKIATVITLLAVVSIIVVSVAKQQRNVVMVSGNTQQKPLEIELGKYQDSDCGMIIDTLEYASQVVAKDGKTWFFHDHGGMANWISQRDFEDSAVIWVMSKDSKRWIDGRKAWYSRTDTTPMLYGFGAYEHKQEGFIDYETMQRMMLRGENLTNPIIKRQLLGSD
ncbi:MAG: hypothetical protein ACQESH_02485 [Campylobacterota bacterium]